MPDAAYIQDQLDTTCQEAFATTTSTDTVATRSANSKFDASNAASQTETVEVSLSPYEVQAVLSKLPAIDQHGEVVEVSGEGGLEIRLPFRSEFLGLDVWNDSGARVFSGPTVLGFTDTALYACIAASLGADALGIIQSMTTNFLRPAKAADLVAKVRVIRRGRRSVYLEAFVYSDGDAEPISHTTATATIR